MPRQQLIRLTSIAALAALSIALLMAIPGIPIFPIAPYLKYDMADVPMIVASLLFGPLYGIVILVIVSAIQAFLIIGDGIIGFAMHVIASSFLVAIPGLFLRGRRRVAARDDGTARLRLGLNGTSTQRLIIGLVLGTLGMTAAMILFNLLITPIYTGMPRSAIAALLLPAIIPFNLIKGGINSAIAAGVALALRPLAHRLTRMSL